MLVLGQIRMFQLKLDFVEDSCFCRLIKAWSKINKLHVQFANQQRLSSAGRSLSCVFKAEVCCTTQTHLWSHLLSRGQKDPSDSPAEGLSNTKAQTCSNYSEASERFLWSSQHLLQSSYELPHSLVFVPRVTAAFSRLTFLDLLHFVVLAAAHQR